MMFMRFAALAFLIALSGSAATLTTREGKILQGEVRFATASDGSQSVTVRPEGGFALSFKLSDVANVAYRPPLVGVLSGGTLPGDWGVSDVGSPAIAGSSVFSRGTFELRGEGAEFGKRNDSFHFVWQRLPYQGQLVARVSYLSDGPGRPLVGLMARQNLESLTRYVMLGVGADGQTGLVYKDNLDYEAKVIVGPQVKPPCWLKLIKYGDVVIGSASSEVTKPAKDARWQFVGRVEFPALRKSYFGMMLTSRHTGDLAIAHFDHVALQRNGLKAEFFADGQMTDPTAARIDPNIDFDWSKGVPEFNVPPEEWWARWTGRIAISSTDDYSFYFNAVDPARLWINGQKILDNTSRVPRPPSIRLQAEHEYDVRVEFHKTRPDSPLQLLWRTPSQPPAVIPTDAFIYREDADEAARAKHSPLYRFVPLARGALLVDGTFLPGAPKSLDAKSVGFHYCDQTEMKLPTEQVARLTFQPLANSAANKVAGHGTGLLTQTGEFVEGDCQSIDDKSLKISSVVFGTSTFDVKTQAAAVILRPAPPGKGWIIHTLKGAVLRAESLKSDNQNLILKEPLLGNFAVPLSDLIDITAPD